MRVRRTSTCVSPVLPGEHLFQQYTRTGPPSKRRHSGRARTRVRGRYFGAAKNEKKKKIKFTSTRHDDIIMRGRRARVYIGATRFFFRKSRIMFIYFFFFPQKGVLSTTYFFFFFHVPRTRAPVTRAPPLLYHTVAHARKNGHKNLLDHKYCPPCLLTVSSNIRTYVGTYI